uniref:Uncharacterized protein n=1 Tax=Meloidogyne enterolobii TaxID=390850 RepID=A0A6V7WN45_MELEN|nr:unnamed protein product [Meloidogyne enterolobii]
MSQSKLNTKNILFLNNPIFLIIFYLILIQFCFASKLNNQQQRLVNSPLLNHKINIRSEQEEEKNEQKMIN